MIWDLDEPVIAVVSALVGGAKRDFGPCRTLALIDGGEVVGGVIIHDWNPEAGTAEISGGSRSARVPYRSAARQVAEFVFGSMGCQAAILRTAGTNKTTRRLARSMGAQEYIIPRMRGRTASEAILIITDDAWRASGWSRHETSQPS